MKPEYLIAGGFLIAVAISMTIAFATIGGAVYDFYHRPPDPAWRRGGGPILALTPTDTGPVSWESVLTLAPEH